MRITVLIVLATIFLMACSASTDEITLLNGDLVFVEGDTGNEADNAITGATGVMSHVGIVEVCGDSVMVIDATKCGVRRQTMDEFIEAQRNMDGVVPAMHFCRLFCRENVDEYVSRAHTFIGQEYDLAFLPDNGKLYCSELVWECYRNDGEPLFEASPMNFRNSKGEFDQFWIDLFASQNMGIPQDTIGTNPSDMFHSDIIYELD